MKLFACLCLMALLGCGSASVDARGTPTFTADEKDWMRQNPIVRYVVDKEAPPIEYVDGGEYRGLAADYLRAVGQKSGLQFEMVETDSWQDAQQAFLAKKADMFPNVAPYRVADRVANQLFFTAPYFVTSSIIVTRSETPVILDLQDLNGKVVATRENGTYSSEIARRHPEFLTLLVAQYSGVLDAVANGTAYAAIGPDTILVPMMRRQYAQGLGVSGPYGEVLYTNQMGVRADLPHLRSIIVKSLASLSARETDVLNHRWFEQADFGKPSLLSIVRYRAPALLLLLTCIALLGWIAYRARAEKHAKSHFLAVMSHEIRTPLNAILGNLELLARSPLSAQQVDRLKTIRSSSDSLQAIVSDILDFSKIEAGELRLETVDFDVVELAEQALQIFAPVARAKGLRLHATFTTATAQTMAGDPARLRQIVHNLLSNAIKFTLSGHVTLHLAIEQSVGASKHLAVSIADTGIGMTPKQQRALFRPFVQADSSINRRFGGSGLGLSLSQQLAAAMGGTIVVSSELGVGSRFTLRIPLPSSRAVNPEQQVFRGELAIVLSSSREWREFSVPHLSAWGLSVRSFGKPSEIPPHLPGEAHVLVICAEDAAWSPAEENLIIEEVACVVDCSVEGPTDPVHTGRIISVSSLSLKGLETALRIALRHPSAQMAALQSPSSQGATPAARASSGKTRRLRIVVAEDNPVNRHLLAEQLSILGCESRILASGQEALEVLAEGRWDVLLTDLNMPEMSGYELSGTVRARWPAMPIMAVTADATAEEHARCKATGMEQVLTKPLSLETLHDVLTMVAHRVGATLSDAKGDQPLILGERPLPASLRETFVISCLKSLGLLSTLRKNGDSRGVASELHSLSGALAVFGHKPLARHCAEIGRRIGRDGLSSMDQPLSEFEQTVRVLIDQSRC